MKHLTLLLLFVHINFHFSLVASMIKSALVTSNYDVECNDICSCSQDYTIHCQDLHVSLDDQHSNGTEVVIKCFKPHANLSVLTGIEITAEFFSSVTIQGCNLPNSSFSDFLKNIGVSDFQKLTLTSYSGKLLRRHFENLNKVHTLRLSHSDLGRLPVDVFKGLPNLIELKLDFSSFYLTKDIFQYTKNHERVYLDNNTVSSVNYEVFNDLQALQRFQLVGTNNNSFIFDGSKKLRTPYLTHFALVSIKITTRSNLSQSVNSSNHAPLVDTSASDFNILLTELRQNTIVKDIQLINNTVTGVQLQPRCFADWLSLENLTISVNNLESVPQDAFYRSKNIKYVNFSSNCIKSFEEDTFSDLESLEKLIVNNNRIYYLPERLFTATTNLKILDLSNNMLKNIEPGLFSHLTQLSVLFLSHNNIAYISGEQFAQLESLRIVDLSHNQLISLVQDPLLSDLDHSVFYRCSGLRVLALQHNFLTEFYEDWRLQLTRLVILDLSDNNITDVKTLNIRLDMITATYDRERITTGDLNRNYTTFHDDRDYQIETGIADNPLNCNCDLVNSWYSLFQNLTKKKTYIDKATCKTPARLVNVTIREIDWSAEYEKCKQLSPEKCPEGCRCVYRPLTRSSVINCQYSHLQTYPRTLPVAPDANHTELNLYGNRLREFRLPDDPGYKNVTFLNLANNSLSALDISGASKGLKKLDLRQNNLSMLSEETLELLEKSEDLERLELADNPWNCDLSNYHLALLVQNKDRLIWKNVTCPDGSPIEIIIDLHHATRNKKFAYMVSSFVAFLLIAVFILTMLYYRNRQRVLMYCFSSRWKVLRWLVSHPDIDDDDKLYDAFIVYAHEDEMLVENHLVPYLEETEERKYKLCLHYRDWIPGEQILSQIGRSVRSSRRTIVVLSPNFLRSVWGVAEFRIAHAEALKDGTARVIVILYEEVADEEVDEELKAYLQTNTYVKWGSPWFWKQLTYALPHPPDRERGVLHYFSRKGRFQGDSKE